MSGISRGLQNIGWMPLCTPGMGVNLWGENPLYMKPVLSSDDGNESYIRRQAPSPSYGVSRGHHCEVVSLSAERQVKEAGVQSCDPTCLCGHADKRKARRINVESAF